MSALPTCPNHLEGRCARSELVLAGEAPKFWAFICRCCHLEWMVSKPHGRQEAAYRNEVERLQRASAADREASRRASVFIAPRGGWQQ